MTAKKTPEMKIAQFQELNSVIHPKTRLAIMTFLVGAGESSFTDLKTDLELTDGNLNLHMKVLEENGYVKVQKTFVRRRPRTTYQVTSKGRRAFQEYVTLLERIIGLSSSKK
jgi:predicted ArsR family transcriptional regulator